MMTWMTRKSLLDSAEDLALPQLALARRESEALFNEMVFGEPDPEHGSAPAPLVGMWSGYEAALAAYSVGCAAILVAHGVTDSHRALAVANTVKDMRANGDPMTFEMPPWTQDIDVLMSHRSNLMRRWPEHYRFPRNPVDMPYLWPIVDDDGGYVLKLSKYDRELIAKGERKLSKTVMERIET
ncbi:hypothetical protein SEA_TINYMINY_54 [Microbacterium phage TinyMiny]|nr:hypothetical protein SEA_TINYMINY_54 [Microbacterium phage TinyMiny]